MTDDTTAPAASLRSYLAGLTRNRRVFLTVGVGLVFASLTCMVLFFVIAEGWDAYLPVVEGGPLEVVPHSDAAYPYAGFGMLSMVLGVCTIRAALTRGHTLQSGAKA